MTVGKVPSAESDATVGSKTMRNRWLERIQRCIRPPEDRRVPEPMAGTGPAAESDYWKAKGSAKVRRRTEFGADFDQVGRHSTNRMQEGPSIQPTAVFMSGFRWSDSARILLEWPTAVFTSGFRWSNSARIVLERPTPTLRSSFPVVKFSADRVGTADSNAQVKLPVVGFQRGSCWNGRLQRSGQASGGRIRRGSCWNGRLQCSRRAFGGRI